MAGPTMRAPLNIEEFSAMAFIRSSLPTMSTRNACRAGMSNALTTPCRADKPKMCHTCTLPVRVSAARTRASSMAAVWVAMTTRCRLCRSAIVPPKGAMRKTGIWPAKPTAPNKNDEPVRRYTSQAWAIFCIQVPIKEISWPLKKSWKLRCRNARKVTGSLLGRVSAAGLRPVNSGAVLDLCSLATEILSTEILFGCCRPSVRHRTKLTSSAYRCANCK